MTIAADLHSHTHYSHGAATPREMADAARTRGLSVFGISEHSPRPAGYDYAHEYREKLAAGFDEYAARVRELQNLAGLRVLFGMEMDWLDGEIAFIRKACAAHDFDYLIGSVHFLDRWGFDDQEEAWLSADEKTSFARYERYFELWRDMLASGIFQIAAHPDLIKIFSAPMFREWLKRPQSLAQIEACLKTLKRSGMAMEISSAGLRKPCREIYPCPEIMALAAKTGVEATFASDAHKAADVGRDFDVLAAYARKFGFSRQLVFCRGATEALPF